MKLLEENIADWSQLPVDDLDTAHLQNISTEYKSDRMARILLSLKRIPIQRKFIDLKSNFFIKKWFKFRASE